MRPCSLLASQAAQAQDTRASPPLPSFPQVYETADLKIRVVKVADGLANPWSLAWLPNGDLLITERAGRLRMFRNGVLDPEPIAGVPEVRITALGGLARRAAASEFRARTELFYLTLRERRRGQSRDDGARARATRRQEARRTSKEIFVAENWSNSPTNFGGRMVFGRDGMLYLAVGERQEQDRAQNTMLHGGKVLRFDDDGNGAADNPFAGKPGYLPEIYSVGHRSPQGLAVHPVTGELYGRTSTARSAATRSTSCAPARTTAGRS